MVDFQSRDTQRDRDGDDASADDDPPTPDQGEAESASAEPADGDADDPERGVAVVSIGGEHSIEDDPAGDAAVAEVEAADGRVVTRELIDASFDGVQKTVDALVDRRDVYAVVTTGGTGVEPDDVTVEAVRQMLDKELPGFGELVRRSCYDEVGAAVIRTRATAGVMGGVVCFCLPGDPDVVRRSVRDVVAPEAAYTAALAAPDDAAES